jgi:hypothetical protein
VNRGIAGIRLAPGTFAGAPVSGVQLGLGDSGPVTVRFFRLTGTRIVVASAILPAQLIAVRVAAAGTPVQVISSRPQFWEPLLPRGGPFAVTGSELAQPSGGPSLIVDDRPGQARGRSDVQPWQCRLEVRTDWARTELPSFAYTDLAVLGGVPAELTGAVASVFGVAPAATGRLAHLEPERIAVLRRGRIEYLELNPTPAERTLLEATRGSGAPAPIWR